MIEEEHPEFSDSEFVASGVVKGDGTLGIFQLPQAFLKLFDPRNYDMISAVLKGMEQHKAEHGDIESSVYINRSKPYKKAGEDSPRISMPNVFGIVRQFSDSDNTSGLFSFLDDVRKLQSEPIKEHNGHIVTPPNVDIQSKDNAKTF